MSNVGSSPYLVLPICELFRENGLNLVVSVINKIPITSLLVEDVLVLLQLFGVRFMEVGVAGLFANELASVEFILHVIPEAIAYETGLSLD